LKNWFRKSVLKYLQPLLFSVIATIIATVLKKLALYIIVFFLAKSSVAQFQLSGTVYDSTKRNLVMDVQVICTCGTMTFTDSTGFYSIYVGAKDSVFFFFNNRPTQKFSVASIRDVSAFDISIQMHVPGRYKQLKEIIVYGKNRRQDSIDNRVQYDKVFNFDKGGVRFSGAAPEAGIGAGIELDALINVFRFRRNKSMARFQERLIREEQNKYIDYRFNKTIILRLTTLKDDPLLDEFIRRYRPDYDILTQVIDIELFQYIQTAAKDFQREKGL
jgi:hypothetical protein